MIRRAVRCVVTLSAYHSPLRCETFAPISIMPAGWPMRRRSGVEAVQTSCTTVPSTAAATAVHIDDVPGNVRCVLPMEIARASRSICSAAIVVPLLF